MNQLPDLLVRAPKVFYILAVLVFFATFWMTYYEVKSAQMPFGPEDSPVVRAALLRAILQGCLDSIWIAANGILFDFLIRFWNRHAPSSDLGENK
ncbi:hypothetical protein [Parasphingorhabdus sp.]|uniref:hypothetical protein n=1 Tax=Parasphingorhabdus sp. TaxID=2709688 RepID=UPI003BB0E94B